MNTAYPQSTPPWWPEPGADPPHGGHDVEGRWATRDTARSSSYKDILGGGVPSKLALARSAGVTATVGDCSSQQPAWTGRPTPTLADKGADSSSRNAAARSLDSAAGNNWRDWPFRSYRHRPVPLLLKPVPGPPRSRASMPASKSDLPSRASMVTGLSCPAAASTSAFSRHSSPIAASYSPTAARWAAVSPGSAYHLPAWFWSQREIAGLVLVHPDDPGHSGVIERPGWARAGCSRASCPAVTSIPSRMCWVNQQPGRRNGHEH